MTVIDAEWIEEFARKARIGDNAQSAWVRLMDRMPEGSVLEARFAVIWLRAGASDAEGPGTESRDLAAVYCGSEVSEGGRWPIFHNGSRAFAWARTEADGKRIAAAMNAQFRREAP